MNGSPNKRQKHWHTWLRSYGCSCQDQMSSGDNAIHHIAGAKAKLKGVKKFGEWYVICLSYWCHQDGRNSAARHVNKHQFEMEYGKEKDLFIERVQLYKSIHGYLPMDKEEYQIIVDRA